MIELSIAIIPNDFNTLRRPLGGFLARSTVGYLSLIMANFLVMSPIGTSNYVTKYV